jgi:hypothetical protein
MKKKQPISFLLSLLSLLLLSLSSLNAFSLEGKGIRVIETKIICKGKHVCDAAAFSMEGLVSLQTNRDPYVGSHVEAAYFPVNYLGKLFGTFSVGLPNDTNKTQYYSFTFEIKCGEDSMTFWRKVEVEAGGYGTDSIGLALYTEKNKIGDYPILASTTLEGDAKRHVTNSAILYVTAGAKK